MKKKFLKKWKQNSRKKQKSTKIKDYKKQKKKLSK